MNSVSVGKSLIFWPEELDLAIGEIKESLGSLYPQLKIMSRKRKNGKNISCEIFGRSHFLGVPLPGTGIHFVAIHILFESDVWVTVRLEEMSLVSDHLKDANVLNRYSVEIRVKKSH